MPDEPGRDDDMLGVLDRMTIIFEAFDDDQGLGLSELALRAGLPKSTVSRLVSGLVRQRYLERDGKLIYLGLRLFELGQLAEMPRELRYAALPVMANLRSETGHTVHLAIREGHEMMHIAIMRGRDAAAPAARIGGRIPAHATALGKAVLAHSDDREMVISGALTARTPQTITDPERLLSQLAETRRLGFATEVRESSPEVACVASPVFSPAGAVIAAISVCVPVADFAPDRLAPRVRTAARALEHRLALRGSGSR